MTLWLHETKSTAVAAAPLSQLLGRAPRLLLADDDDDLRWALADALGDSGFDVEQVTSSFELLDRFAEAVASWEGRPDVVVSDVRMPGYSALNVVSGLRDAGWHIPVVFISAFDDDVCKKRIRGLTRATIMRKPLSVPSLVDVIEQLVWAFHAERG